MKGRGWGGAWHEALATDHRESSTRRRIRHGAGAGFYQFFPYHPGDLTPPGLQILGTSPTALVTRERTGTRAPVRWIDFPSGPLLCERRRPPGSSTGWRRLTKFYQLGCWFDERWRLLRLHDGGDVGRRHHQRRLPEEFPGVEFRTYAPTFSSSTTSPPAPGARLPAPLTVPPAPLSSSSRTSPPATRTRTLFSGITDVNRLLGFPRAVVHLSLYPRGALLGSRASAFAFPARPSSSTSSAPPRARPRSTSTRG